LAALAGSELDGARQIIEILTQQSSHRTGDFSEISKLLTGNEKALSGLKRIEDLLQIMATLTSDMNINIVADFKIARGLAYYTGMVFETTMDSLPEFGSISSGGRYNNLTQRFVDRDLPGVGGSIGLDRLVAALLDQAQSSPQARSGVFIVPTEEGFESWIFPVAHSFRLLGLTAEVSVKSGKLGKQFALADKLQRAFALVIGPDEFKSQTVTVKDLTSGEQIDQVSLETARQFVEKNS
jgi:histidyl-tRNA synthetase